jgi:hypothetical protein
MMNPRYSENLLLFKHGLPVSTAQVGMLVLSVPDILRRERLPPQWTDIKSIRFSSSVQDFALHSEPYRRAGMGIGGLLSFGHYVEQIQQLKVTTKQFTIETLNDSEGRCLEALKNEQVQTWFSEMREKYSASLMSLYMIVETYSIIDGRVWRKSFTDVGTNFKASLPISSVMPVNLPGLSSAVDPSASVEVGRTDGTKGLMEASEPLLVAVRVAEIKRTWIKGMRKFFHNERAEVSYDDERYVFCRDLLKEVQEQSLTDKSTDKSFNVEIIVVEDHTEEDITVDSYDTED